MKKTITRTETRTVDVCDLCERDCSNGYKNTCFICRRETCLTCSRFFDFAGKNQNRIIELAVKICHECEAKAETLHYPDRIQAVVEGADKKARDMIDEWRTLVKPKGATT